MRIVVPSPWWLLREIVPPCCSMIFLRRAYRGQSLLLSCIERLEDFFASSSPIPPGVSDFELQRFHVRSRVILNVPPSGIASIALSMRFIKAPRMEDSSIIPGGVLLVSERRTSILFAVICGRSSSKTSLTI